MNFRLRRKDVVETSGYKISAGYCDLYFLLVYQERIGYTRGTYGWNCDVYKVDNFIITTGYRGTVGTRADFKLTSEYNKKAEKIYCNLEISREEARVQINKLLYEFLEKIKEMQL